MTPLPPVWRTVGLILFYGNLLAATGGCLMGDLPLCLFNTGAFIIVYCSLPQKPWPFTRK